MELEFQRAFSIRKEVCSIAAYRSDPEQLKKFKAIFLEIYQTQSLFAKYFTYGNQKVRSSFITVAGASQHHSHLVRLIHKGEEAIDESDI